MIKNTLSYRNKGFTLLEMMLIVMIFGFLATALYVSVGPYMTRSRDTGRMVRVDTLSNVFDAYKKSADKFPSQYGSGSPIVKGYCISELLNRSDGTTVDTKFSAISKWVQGAPIDPLGTRAVPIWPCDLSGSYFYSILNDGVNDETAIIASRLENQTASNYGTGADLQLHSMAQYLYLNTKKGTVPSSAPDAIYFRSGR